MMEDVPPQKIQELSTTIAELTEKNKELSAKSKLFQQGEFSYYSNGFEIYNENHATDVAKIKSTPTDADLADSILRTQEEVLLKLWYFWTLTADRWRLNIWRHPISISISISKTHQLKLQNGPD